MNQVTKRQQTFGIHAFGLLGAFITLSACSPATQSAEPATQTPRQGHTVRDYPGTLRPPSELGADFQWRQQVTAHWPQGTRSFDAVLSKSDNKLVLVGLGPMDTPGFVLTLDAQAKLKFENHTGEPARFNPRYVVLDVQRAFYPWFTQPLQVGQRETLVDEERVTETWQDGVLKQRTFTRLDNNPPGSIVITYEGWAPGRRAPERATLDSGWFGYKLTIQTFEQSN